MRSFEIYAKWSQSSQAHASSCKHDIDLPEIFECAYLKFSVSGRSEQASRQASKHTHARAQCSHASVGLAQARPNYQLQGCIYFYIRFLVMGPGYPLGWLNLQGNFVLLWFGFPSSKYLASFAPLFDSSLVRTLPRFFFCSQVATYSSIMQSPTAVGGSLL